LGIGVNRDGGGSWALKHLDLVFEEILNLLLLFYHHKIFGLPRYHGERSRL